MFTPFIRRTLTAAVLAVSAAGFAKAPVIVTSIKPVHSLIAQVTEGVTEPQLLIKEGSPHGYQLKPSDVKALAGADLAVWTSDDLETLLPAAAEKAGVKQVLVWAELPDVKLLKNRKGGLWDEADEDVHEGFSHAAGGEDREHDHSHEHGGHHHHHHHGVNNPHVWLSTENAAVLVKAAAKKFAEIDPEHKAQYEANADKALTGLKAEHDKLAAKLKPFAESPFMVFHDAYPYFEAEFNLHPVGVVRADPEHEPGAGRVAELRKLFEANKIQCIFNEPQFPSKLASKLAAGTGVKQAELDPVGAAIPAGPALYNTLLENIADNLAGCLTSK